MKFLTFMIAAALSSSALATVTLTPKKPTDCKQAEEKNVARMFIAHGTESDRELDLTVQASFYSCQNGALTEKDLNGMFFSTSLIDPSASADPFGEESEAYLPLMETREVSDKTALIDINVDKSEIGEEGLHLELSISRSWGFLGSYTAILSVTHNDDGTLKATLSKGSALEELLELIRKAKRTKDGKVSMH